MGFGPVARLVYQRWIEIDAPVFATGPTPAPMWSWPVPLGDGRVMLTLLYRPLGMVTAAPQTRVLLLDAEGTTAAWPFAEGYPAPVISYAHVDGTLVGLDLVKTGKVYACDVDGVHRWTLEAALRMGCLIAPLKLFMEGTSLYWVARNNVPHAADLSTGTPSDVRAVESTPEAPAEVHFPHTHYTADGSLFILDFDPMPRITRYSLVGS